MTDINWNPKFEPNPLVNRYDIIVTRPTEEYPNIKKRIIFTSIDTDAVILNGPLPEGAQAVKAEYPIIVWWYNNRFLLQLKDDTYELETRTRTTVSERIHADADLDMSYLNIGRSPK